MKFILSLIAVFLFSFNSLAAGDNHIGLFLGATTADSSTDITFGMDYERKTPWLDGKIGVGLILDNVFAKKNIFIIGLPVFWHPIEGLKLVLAPAYEFKEGGSGAKAKQKYLTRIGAGYDFHIDHYSVGPMVSVDLIDGGSTAVVYGVAAGMGF